MKQYEKSCVGCVYDGQPKCSIMKSPPKERFCHRTLEQSLKMKEDQRRYAKKR